MTELERYMGRVRPGRKVTGVAAALLPFDSTGHIAEEAFARHLRATDAAGLMNAVNMDTGYVNYLTDGEKLRVLRITREALGPRLRFVAGAYIEDREGDIGSLYRREIDAIVGFGGTPILFQTARLHGRSTARKVGNYKDGCRGSP